MLEEPQTGCRIFLWFAGCLCCPLVLFHHSPTATTEVPVSVGSLILHFEDNSTRKIEYASDMECEVINMKPEHPIVRVVVASAHFVLYNRRDRRGRQYPVSSTREKEYSAQELGFTKVGRYIQALIGPAPSLLRSHWSRASDEIFS